MLNEDILLYIFYFCHSMKDACRLLIAINIKPNGIYCKLLQRVFLKPTSTNSSFRKFYRYVYKPSGKASALHGYKIVDTRYLREHPVIFKSNAMELIDVKLNTKHRWKCQLILQDPTGFYHLRMNGFIRHFCETNNYDKKQFRDFFQDNKLVAMTPKIYACFANSKRQPTNHYVILTFSIYFDPIEQHFFPFPSSYRFLSRS
jgi:hypothetical protein